MRVIAIGDIHGRNIWERIIQQPAEQVVFIGDYLDSLLIDNQVQIQNLVRITELVYQQPEKYHLLLGNHDYHYLSMIDQQYSGWNLLNKNLSQHIYSPLLKEGLLKIAHLVDDVLYTHAGLTQTFFQELNRINPMEDLALDDYLNLMFQANPYRFCFGFFRENEVNIDTYGDDIFQSPLWVRPPSLKLDAYPIAQVVGHTFQEEIQIDQGIAWIDSLERNNYLQIIDGKFQPYQLN